jgi:uncharacterized protein YodC (DUF2158 family)
MADQFRKGDKVKLKGGGPVMTVEGPASEKLGLKRGGNKLICAWFDEKTLKRDGFDPETLEKAEEPEKIENFFSVEKA